MRRRRITGAEWFLIIYLLACGLFLLWVSPAAFLFWIAGGPQFAHAGYHILDERRKDGG